jgi:5-methylcytosine-specific restriction endonuclease McrA
VTNRKLRFSAIERGGEVALSKVLNVGHAQVCNLSIEATSSSLSGDYVVGDAEWAAAVIDTTLRIDRRVILPGAERRSPLPQHVKTEVWQRDHGRCVQCSASDYLEFDHIIPRAKGGANSVGNIQLLCRRCNLRKSDRI